MLRFNEGFCEEEQLLWIGSRGRHCRRGCRGSVEGKGERYGEVEGGVFSKCEGLLQDMSSQSASRFTLPMGC